jgi:dihydroorotate dehydrogenase (NAD+) catalytic subunit
MVDLGVELVGVRLANPLVLASGILGVSPWTLRKVARLGAGAVTAKSIGPEPTEGHPNPTVISTEHWVLNAVGLSNPGVEEGVKEVEMAVKKVRAPVIASFFAKDVEGFGVVAERLSMAKPALLEANLSCPNVMEEQGFPFAYEPDKAAEVVKAIKKRVGGVPLVAKLSPNTYKLKEVAKAVEEAGADAINMGNTMGPGMAINLEARKPVIANKVGGVSGPALKPIQVRCVWDVFESVKIPVIGTGGVLTGMDAIEMMMAGARAVGIGSALAYRGQRSFKLIAKEMDEWLAKNGHSNVNEIVGVAHEG